MKRKNVRPEIQEELDKIDRGEKLGMKITKMRVPLKDGEEDWDNAEVISVEEK